MLIVNAKKRHFKSNEESCLTDAAIMLGIMALFGVVFVVMCISRKANIAEELSKAKLTDGAVLLYLFMALYCLYYLVRHFIYAMNRRTILAKGTKWQGTFEGTEARRMKMVRSSPNNYRYVYTVKAPDGRTVKTESYPEDYVDKFRLKICTVYEYKNKRYFTDFQ